MFKKVKEFEFLGSTYEFLAHNDQCRMSKVLRKALNMYVGFHGRVR